MHYLTTSKINYFLKNFFYICLFCFISLLIFLKKNEVYFDIVFFLNTFIFFTGFFPFYRYFKNNYNHIPFLEIIFLIYSIQYSFYDYFILDLSWWYFININRKDLLDSQLIYFIFHLGFLFITIIFQNLFKKYNKIYEAANNYSNNFVFFFSSSRILDFGVVVLCLTFFFLNRTNWIFCNGTGFKNLDIKIHFFFYLFNFIFFFIMTKLFLLESSTKEKSFISKYSIFLFYLAFLFYFILTLNGSSGAGMIMLLIIVLFTCNFYKKKIIFSGVILIFLVSLSIFPIKENIRKYLDNSMIPTCNKPIFTAGIVLQEIMNFYISDKSYMPSKLNKNIPANSSVLDKTDHTLKRFFERLDQMYLFSNLLQNEKKENFQFIKGISYNIKTKENQRIAKDNNYPDRINWKWQFYRDMGFVIDFINKDAGNSPESSSYNFPILLEAYYNYSILGLLFLIFFYFLLNIFINFNKFILEKYFKIDVSLVLIISFSHFFIIENHMIFTLKNSLYTLILFYLIIFFVVVFEKIIKKYIKI